MSRLSRSDRRNRARLGFTLAEVLIVLMILGIVGAAIFRVLVKQQQSYTDSSRQAAMQREIRLTGSFLPAELRSTSSAGQDVIQMDEDKVTFLANIGSSIICGKVGQTIYLPPLNAAGVITTNWYTVPAIGDSIFLFDDGNDAGTIDDAWQRRAVAAISNNFGVCAGAPYTHPTQDAGKARWQVTVSAAIADSVKVGNVVRFSRPVRYQLYSVASGKWYVGLQEHINGAWSTMEPVGGPFRAFAAGDASPSGLQFRYFDSLGVRLTTAAQRTRVSRVDVYLRTNAGLASVRERRPNDLRDSVMMRIAVRNFK